ncbi:MAG: BCD family MFS transporter [Chloroflexota bacterium]
MTSKSKRHADHLTLGRNLKIGLFHLGSGMADVLITGVWNRIMISDLGFRATPVSLLASLRYFLAPLSVWAGRQSDKHALFGYHRLFWIWSGRALMAVSMVLLGFLTASLVGGAAAGLAMWLGLTAAMLLFSLGNALSGSVFLALVYDRAPEHQRGRAVGVVWTFLLTGFAVGGAFFALMLPSAEGATTDVLPFTAAELRNLFLVAALAMSTMWFFSLFGEERRVDPDAPKTSEASGESVSLQRDLRTALDSPPLRQFMGYLALSMAFAFSQDTILEPFAGDVFDMPADVTTRFAAYWGTTAIIGSVAFLALSRRFHALDNRRMSQAGVLALICTFALYAIAAVLKATALVTPGLLLLGLGLGMWNIGTLGLMMEMSPDGQAGTFLGFWTLVVTLSRGLGVSGGGILRDLALVLSGNLVTSYVAVFALGAVGLAVSYLFLLRTDPTAFREDYTPSDPVQVMSAALD